MHRNASVATPYKTEAPVLQIKRPAISLAEETVVKSVAVQIDSTSFILGRTQLCQHVPQALQPLHLCRHLALPVPARLAMRRRRYRHSRL